MADSASITQLLRDWSAGDSAALDQLTPQVQRELHALARRYLRKERGNQTLQPTALINEVYLRLIDQSQPVQWAGRSHFFGIAAHLMRNILVDYARARRAAKRGGDAVHVTLSTAAGGSAASQAPDMIDLDDALNRLALLDQRKAKIIELRYFGGMTREEIACASGLTLSTVKRDLRLAEAWLRRELRGKV
jgi:RNA polymerase sigma factor (TIGR02999 family)